jgi:hypothetical protein
MFKILPLVVLGGILPQIVSFCKSEKTIDRLYFPCYHACDTNDRLEENDMAEEKSQETIAVYLNLPEPVHFKAKLQALKGRKSLHQQLVEVIEEWTEKLGDAKE